MPVPHVPVNPSFPAPVPDYDGHTFNVRLPEWPAAWITAVSRSYGATRSQVVHWLLEEGVTPRPETETAPAGLPLTASVRVVLPGYVSKVVRQIAETHKRTSSEVLRSSLYAALPQAQVWAQKPPTPRAPKLSARYNKLDEARQHARAVNGVRSAKPLLGKNVGFKVHETLAQQLDLRVAKTNTSRSGVIRQALTREALNLTAADLQRSRKAVGTVTLTVHLPLSVLSLAGGRAAELNTTLSELARAALVRDLSDNPAT